MSKLLEKYKYLSSPVKASLWFLVCSFLQKGIAMITTPIFTRIMTEEAYGKFSVYNSWYNIIFVFATLELAAGVYTRGLVKNEEDQEAYSSSLMGLSTVCISICFAIYLIFKNQINSMVDLSTFLMVLMFVEIWANAVFQFWSNKERANFKYKKLVLLTLVYVILRPALSVVFIMNAQSENQVEARILATVIVCVALFGFLYFSMMRKGKRFFDKKYWIYALKFNIPLVPHYLSQILLGQSNKIMIDKLCGSEYAAFYSVAHSLAMVLLVLNSSISGTMNPWIYKTIKAKEYHKIGKASYSVLFLVAAANFAVIAVAPELLKIMAPASYQSALWVIPPLTASVYFTFLYSLFATFEYYYEKTNFVMIASVSGAVLNIVLNYIFINKFGFIASGYVTLLCYIVYAFAHYGFMRKVNKQFMDGYKVYNVKIIVLIGVTLLIASALMMLIYNIPVLRYTVLLCMLALVVVFRKKIINIFKQFGKGGKNNG